MSLDLVSIRKNGRWLRFQLGIQPRWIRNRSEADRFAVKLLGHVRLLLREHNDYSGTEEVVRYGSRKAEGEL